VYRKRPNGSRAQAARHILGGSRFIEKDAGCQFRPLTSGEAYKNRSHFDLAIDIAFALGFRLLHGDTSPAHAGGNSIRLDGQAPDGWAKGRALLRYLRLFVGRLLKEGLDLLFFLLSHGFSHRLDQVESLSL